MVRQLQPFYANVQKRLVKSPKVFLRDSGLLHALLGLETYDALLGHPSAGASWEGFVIEQLLSRLAPPWEAFFYRTSAGAEVDLVLASDRKRVIAVEMKLSAAPTPRRGFWSALEDLGPQKKLRRLSRYRALRPAPRSVRAASHGAFEGVETLTSVSG